MRLQCKYWMTGQVATLRWILDCNRRRLLDCTLALLLFSTEQDWFQEVRVKLPSLELLWLLPSGPIRRSRFWWHTLLTPAYWQASALSSFSSRSVLNDMTQLIFVWYALKYAAMPKNYIFIAFFESYSKRESSFDTIIGSVNWFSLWKCTSTLCLPCWMPAESSAPHRSPVRGSTRMRRCRCSIFRASKQVGLGAAAQEIRSLLARLAVQRTRQTSKDQRLVLLPALAVEHCRLIDFPSETQYQDSPYQDSPIVVNISTETAYLDDEEKSAKKLPRLPA